MDWKTHYQAELAQSDGRDRVAAWLRRPIDERVVSALARGAILSFPHTTLDYAGPLQASVVSGLCEAGIDRVVALGVLHSGGVPVYRRALDPAEPPEVRARCFAEVEGAFALPAERIETPFGPLPARPAGGGPVRVDRADLLEREFSLDTFASVLKLASEVLARPPIPVTAVFVGMTRNPATGSFETARRAASWLRRIVDGRTAVVTTGDVVHYGTAYGLAESDAGEADQSALERAFRLRVEQVLAQAMNGEDETAYHASLDELRNDQREILPVLASFLGPHAAFEILSFSLSDYSRILSTPPPCYVASALLSYG
jgi:hypothetical protein